jgi:hypothetical protein
MNLRPWLVNWLLKLPHLEPKKARHKVKRNVAKQAAQTGREIEYLDLIVGRMNSPIVEQQRVAQDLIGGLVTEIWQTEGDSDFLRRFRLQFLEHLYYLLTRCGDDSESIDQILASLQVAFDDGLRDRKYAGLAKRYCHNLNRLAAAKSGRDVHEIVAKLREVLNDLGTDEFGVEGGRYAYDFYRPRCPTVITMTYIIPNTLKWPILC